MLPQIFSADCRHVHERERLVLSFRVNVGVHRLVIFERLFKKFGVWAFFDFDVFENRVESGVTAMVRPIRVQNADFGFGGIALD